MVPLSARAVHSNGTILIRFSEIVENEAEQWNFADEYTANSKRYLATDNCRFNSSIIAG